MPGIEPTKTSPTEAQPAAGNEARAPIGRLAMLALGSCSLGFMVAATASALFGMPAPQVLSDVGAAVLVVLVGAALGLTVFALLGSRLLFTWAVAVIAESSVRLLATVGVAATIAFDAGMNHLPFWGGYLLASIGVLLTWTQTFRGLLPAVLTHPLEGQPATEPA
ncbi:MAG: hypothetical protein AAGK04_12580 [Planctomycetota bacterium]